MTEQDLIGKTAKIVGLSLDGSPGHGFVAHVCLDVEDGPRVFLQATNEAHEWQIVEERVPDRRDGTSLPMQRQSTRETGR